MVKKRTIYVFLIYLFFFIPNSDGQRRETPPVTFNKISENLYEVLGGQGARSEVIIGDKAVLIIDAKMDETSEKQIFRMIRNLTDKPIRYLVNTHSDGDHIRGNKYFPETVTIISHENCRNDFFLPNSDGSSSEWFDPELMPFVPSLTFRKKMDVYLGSKKIELWHFGIGHTTGDVVVYVPDEKVAFIGDQVMTQRPQLIHAYKGGNTYGHVDNLKKMLETIDAEKFFSGHNDVIDRKEIQNHINQMKTRQNKVNELLVKGKTLDEIKSEFPEEETALVEIIYSEIKEGRR